MIAETILTWVFLLGGIIILSFAIHFLKFAYSSKYRKELKETKSVKKLITEKLTQLETNYDDELIMNELYKEREFVGKIDVVEDFVNKIKEDEDVEFPDLQNIYTIVYSSFVYGVEFELNKFLKNIYEKAKNTECKYKIEMSIKLLKSMKEMKEKFKHHKSFKQICKLTVNRARYNNILKELRDIEILNLVKLAPEEVKTIEKLKIEILDQNLNGLTKENVKNYKNDNIEKSISIFLLTKVMENLSIELNSRLNNLKK